MQQSAAVAETHISTVFFADDRAYKILKALRTPFLDHSTPERRAEACRREVELNARLAPDVYLGTSPILERGEVVDHMIVMRRLPVDRRLSALAGTPGYLDRVAQVAAAVARFHAALRPDPGAARVAGVEHLFELWTTGNLDEMAAASRGDGRPLHDPALLADARERATGYLLGRRSLFERRIAEGHGVDGHGDLLADDIFCLDDGPRILDCLAFDDDLRRGDVLADVAFLAMDLEHRPDGAAAVTTLLDTYVELTDDHHPRSLLHLYVAQRALVRAKVRGLRSLQGDDEACRAAADESAAFLAQCLNHLRAAEVRLVVVGGAPGTGKSTVAAAVAEDLDATLLRSDELRKDLAGRPRGEHAVAGLDDDLYSPAMTERTYGELLRRARRLLESGESVVLDASFTEATHRADARAIAATTRSSCRELRCVLDPQVAARRVAARMEADRADPTGGDPSDATPEIALALAARADPWPEATAIDTAGPRAEAAAAAITIVRSPG